MAFIKHARNTQRQFGWTMIILHWFMALSIIGLFGLGLYMVDLSYYDPFYTLGPKIHEALGIVITLMLLYRFYWKAVNPKPEPPATNSAVVNKASAAAHHLLYVLMVVVLVSGLFISFAGGEGINIFDLFVIPGPDSFFDNQAFLAGEVHFYVACGLMALVALHALAALKHHYIDKDTTLSNMLGIKEKS
ncbi:MAG: cytochrome b [Pseudomonadales bacterium]